MDNLVLLLSILSGILIAWILVTNKQNKFQPRFASTASASVSASGEPASTSKTTVSPSKDSNTKPIVVRVSGIREENALQAKAFIRTTIVERVGDNKDCITDITIVPSCNDTEAFVALIDFNPLPNFLFALNENRQQSHSVKVADDYDLIFDVHFLGLTQTYFTATPQADIIFISGIGSHAYGSWTCKSEPWRMWPRHFLEKRLDARVMVYGHKSALAGTGFAQLIDYGRGFGDALKRARRRDPDRPIIFVAHSFGGNILKSFLVKDAQSSAATLKATRGILFFAVPHRGIDVTDMMTAIKHGNTSQIRLNQISEEHYWRQDLDNFISILKGCKIASFYETELTKKLVQKPNGSFARDGHLVQVMSLDMAVLGLPEDMESKHPVDADHSDIVKFENESCPTFVQALECIQEMLSISDHDAAEIDEKTLKCLQDLQATNPEHDMMRIEDSKDSLLRDCYAWILNDPYFREWQSGDDCPLLLVTGDAGKGKTMLMIALVRELSKSLPVSFFFCQSTDPRLNNASSILRGLIWHLVMNRRHLATTFYKEYEHNKHEFTSPNAMYALFDMLLKMLNHCPGTCILIDALDECNSGSERDQLLHLIMKNSKSSKTRWLLSSRNYPKIKQLLVSKSEIVSLELNEDHLSKSVLVFIEHKTRELAEKHAYSQDIMDAVRNELTARADSTFLWVALACQSLSKVRKGRALSSLQNLPPGLQPLYARMMDQILRIDDEDRDLCLRILRSASLAFRPLLREEMITMAQLSVELLDEGELTTLVDQCGSFITIRKGHLYFVHQSAKDYLVTHGARIIFPNGIQEEHAIVTRLSLKVMSKDLEKDMCRLRHPGSPVPTDINKCLRTISYACSFWVDHLVSYLEGPEIDDITCLEFVSNQGIVHIFLLNSLLNWIEALSLIKQIQTGILALQKLRTMIKDRVNTGIYDLVYDAVQFILHCHVGVEQAPLQLYSSALIFAPERSLVRQTFLKEAPDWITSRPRVQKDWDAMPQNLEGHKHSVNSVAFSPDGQKLASGSQDNTVRLWDVMTGTPLQTLKGHRSGVSTVAFSPDGQQLVSSSSDTVRLWNVTTGAQLQTIEGHLGAFSPNRQQLASVSQDGTIRLWDMTMGALLQTLKGHTGGVNSVTFSPDGQRLVSNSWDTIRLWDVTTGAALQTIEVELGSFESVTFSPDGQQLASNSWDDTIQLWDIKTGTLLQTFEDHMNLQFALNGDDSFTLKQFPLKLHVSKDGDWIKLDREKVIWLPPAYRGYTTKSESIHGKSIAIGCASGVVYILILDTEASLNL